MSRFKVGDLIIGKSGLVAPALILEVGKFESRNRPGIVYDYKVKQLGVDYTDRVKKYGEEYAYVLARDERVRELTPLEKAML
jgi:hypothetical protein